MKWTEDKKMKRFLRRAYRQGNKPAEHPSLMDCDRYRYDEDAGEYGTEYGFLPEKYYGSTIADWSDESIQEWINENMWCRINSPYDCTGQMFTRWIKWHRNPCGRISFVHGFGIDV